MNLNHWLIQTFKYSYQIQIYKQYAPFSSRLNLHHISSLALILAFDYFFPLTDSTDANENYIHASYSSGISLDRRPFHQQISTLDPTNPLIHFANFKISSLSENSIDGWSTVVDINQALISTIDLFGLYHFLLISNFTFPLHVHPAECLWTIDHFLLLISDVDLSGM